MTATIAVIDDSPVVRLQVSKVLESAGYAIVTADDGKEAVRLIEERGNDISLIICDLRMPKMDGMEVLRWVRQSAFAHVPFVMLTTEGSHRFVSEARELGVKGWIVKPFVDDMLVTAARRLVASGGGTSTRRPTRSIR